jgi:hypothetical protein
MLVSQNEDGRLPRDSADLPVHKLVRERVAKDHDALLAEPLNNTDQFILQIPSPGYDHFHGL